MVAVDMLTIERALLLADTLDSDCALVDASWILCSILDCELSYLRLHSGQVLSAEQASSYQKNLDRRRNGEPVAHIIGSQPFWDIDLDVSPSTLIPRQDTETLVESVLELCDSKQSLRVLDLGTGTGAIALALANARPSWAVVGVDYADDIVELAKRNAIKNDVSNASFFTSNWFENENVFSEDSRRFDIIVSNPPYIPENDPHLNMGDLRFEANTALVAADDGLADLRLIIQQSPLYSSESKGLWLFLEHGYNQGEAVRAMMRERGFHSVETKKDIPGNERVTLGFFESVMS